MNRMQKIAIYNLVIFGIAISATVGAFIILVLIAKASGHGVDQTCYAAFGFLGILGFSGLSPLIFKKDKGKVTCDERDILINRRAALTGFVTSYLVTGLACMLPWFILGYNVTISVTWLPFIFLAAGLTSFVVHSISILVQYGQKEKGNE